jgi:hypothetical protein
VDRDVERHLAARDGGGEWVRRRHGELQCRRQPWHGPDGDDRRGRPDIHGITGGSRCDDWERSALVAVWFASQTVKEHPTYAAAACLATLLFSAQFVSRRLS